MPLSTRLFGFVVFLVLVLGITTLVTFDYILSSELPDQQKQWARTLTSSLAESLAFNTINEDISVAAQTLENIVASNDNIEYAYITDFEGKLFTSSELGVTRLVQIAPASNETNLYRELEFRGKQVSEYQFPLIEGMAARIHVGINNDIQHDIINRIENSVFWFLLVAFSASLLFSLFFTRRIIGPVETLSQVFKQYAQNGRVHETSITHERDAEIHALELAFSEVTHARRFAELTLEQERANLQLILDTSGDGIYGIDKKGLCTFANRTCAKLLGVDSSEDLLGLHMHNEFHHKYPGGEPFPVVECKIYHTLVEGKNSYCDDEVFWRKDGSSFPVEYSSHPIVEAGEVIGAVVTFSDITERAANEQQRIKILESIKESEARLVTSQEITHVGSWEWNILGGELYWSDEIYRIFGLQPQEFEATYEGFLSFLHPDDRDAVTAAVGQAIGDDREQYDIEHRIVRPSGEIRTVHERGIVFTDENNVPVRMIGAVHDITEQKTSEQQLAAYRENLEELVEERTRALQDAQDELVRKERLATLGNLTATVSHELRNPLGSIKPSLHVIRRLVQGEDDERIENAITRIEKSVSRCDRIIDELLDFTRITSLNIERVDLDNWLTDILNEHRFLPGIKIEQVKIGKSLLVDIDPERFRRVMINLLDNASHAMLVENSTTQAIPGSVIKVCSQLDGDMVAISVTDNGSGIPADIMPRIFEPLFSTKGFGVGLGMPTVRQIVYQHHGEISIESEPGNTSITLKIPVHYNIANKLSLPATDDK